jgi:hypothetical protein
VDLRLGAALMTRRARGLHSSGFVLAFLGALWLLDTSTGHAGPAMADAGLYDTGFASAAAANCSNTQLRMTPGVEALADADFKRGGDMFVTFVKQLGNETACKMAVNLYDEKVGKVAPLLGRK